MYVRRGHSPGTELVGVCASAPATAAATSSRIRRRTSSRVGAPAEPLVPAADPGSPLVAGVSLGAPSIVEREKQVVLLFCACLACWLSMPTAVPAAWSQSLCACPVLIYLPSVLRMPTRCCCSSSLCHTRASYINYV